MTKQEVLQGATALNGDDKNYTVTTDGDKIILETQYYGTVKRKAIFRFTVRLRGDGTYTESCYNNDGHSVQYGSFSKSQKSVSITFGKGGGKPEIENESFDSEAYKRVLRECLDASGYKKQGFFKRLFGKNKRNTDK